MQRAMILAFALAASSAMAATQADIPEPPRGVAGVVVSVSDTEAVLKRPDGSNVVVPMTRGWTYSKMRRTTSAEIKPGDFIGSRNENLSTEGGRAAEVRIFEPGYRPEEGTHLVALPSTSMTHGDVRSAAAGADGRELLVTYSGGTRKIVVPANVEVTAFDLQDRSSLKPGTAVSGVTRRGPDNVWRASRLVLSER